MPILNSNLSEMTTHILDPIVEQTVRRIIDELGYTTLFDENVYIYTDYMSSNKTSDKNNDAKLRNHKFECEASFQINPSNNKFDSLTFSHMPAYGTMKHLLHTKYPLFSDQDSNVYLYEHQTPCTVVMNCTMTFMDKGLAYKAINDLVNRYVGTNAIINADVSFDYPISHEILVVLYQIFKMKNISGSFLEYLFDKSNNIFGVTTNKTIDNRELVVKRLQTRTIAQIDYSDDKPTPNTTENVPNSFQVQFMYTIQFARPTINHLSYPIIINNQLLPCEYIIYNDDNGMRTLNGDDMNRYMNDYYQKYVYSQYTQVYRIPFYDDWVIPNGFNPQQQNGHKEFLICALLLDENENNLTIEDISTPISKYIDLHPIIKDILKKQGNGSFEHDCIINISVYSNDYILDYKKLKLTNDLKIKFNYLDKQNIYRLVFSEIIDLRYLNPKWYFLLKEYEDYFNIKERGYEFDINGNLKPTDGESGDNQNGNSRPLRILSADIVPCR